MRLMIVDGSNSLRASLSRAVSQGGLPGLALVGMARSASEATRLAEGSRPDVVTVDLTTPGLDGLDCIARLRSSVPGVSLLAVGTLADPAQARHALTRGASAYVPKPYSDDELTAALQALMEKRA